MVTRVQPLNTHSVTLPLVTSLFLYKLGRGIFTSVTFEKGEFLLEYRGQLLNKKECEERLYNDVLKVFMFEFHFNGKLWWCVLLLLLLLLLLL